MAQRSRTNSSGAFGAGSSSKRERDSESGAEQSASGSKRSRMAEAGAVREECEDVQTEQREDGEEAETQQVPDEASQVADEVCPITDKNERPFRLMDMPPEIRIEIYRACLTRPFDVLLSKEPKPVDREKEREEARLRDDEIDEDDDEDEGDSFDDSSLESEAGVQTSSPFPPGADPQASSAAADSFNSNHGTARDAEAWVPRRTRSLRSLARSSPQRSASASASTSANPPTNPVQTWALAPRANNSVRPTPPASGPRNNHTSFPPRARRFGLPQTSTSTDAAPTPPRAPRPQDVDPLLVNLLRASKLIYKESRAVFYGENNFLLDLDTAQSTLAALHQRSRGQIKNLRVTIPTHNEILERFAEVVRLSLRYCWRLQRFVIHTPFVLPGAEGSSTSGNTTVYANAFDILRWLPRQCEVVLEGTVSEEIRRVVEKNSTLAKSLDELGYARRQLISNDAQRLPITR